MSIVPFTARYVFVYSYYIIREQIVVNHSYIHWLFDKIILTSLHCLFDEINLISITYLIKPLLIFNWLSNSKTILIS